MMLLIYKWIRRRPSEKSKRVQPEYPHTTHNAPDRLTMGGHIKIKTATEGNRKCLTAMSFP